MTSSRKASHNRAPHQPDAPVHKDNALLALGALLVVAMAFGGGGVRYGLANLIVQLTALGLVAIYRDAFLRFWRTAPRLLTILVGFSVAIPALHLVPLPADVWTALPGRGLAAEARAAVDARGWAPASLDRARTLVALTGLIVPLTVLCIGWTIKRERVFMLGWLIVAMGLVNVFVGVGQALSSDALTSFYPETPMAGVLFGTFANRNSTGVFLVCALTLACLLPPIKAHPLELPARLAVCALLLLAIVLTKSRTSLALAGLPLLLAAAGFAFDRIASSSSKQGSGATRALQLGGGALVVVLAVVSLFAAAPGRLGDTLERFERDGSAREYIWEDSLYASQRYWPAGAGMGTFDEVFQVDEALENITARRAGRAHNDYLEVAIEAGLPGLLAIAVWLLALAWLTWRARFSPHRWIAWSGSAILLAIALQSITDYPLRNQTMLAVGAFALLLLARFSSVPERRKRSAP
ncbi:MAG: O-antigen ligase family protein [Pseudomonadota bacterium]